MSLLDNCGLGHLVLCPKVDFAEAFAPSNIALIKYWGKRDVGYNLPQTDSISVSLDPKGAQTKLTAAKCDQLILNDQILESQDPVFIRLFSYLDALFPCRVPLAVHSHSSVAIAAGLASSASGFAALVLALDKLCQWQLEPTELSILARLGSGSAARSIYPKAWVRMHKGQDPSGRDSFATAYPGGFSDACLGVVPISCAKKSVSSTKAMGDSVATSPFYGQWPRLVEDDIGAFEEALGEDDFLKAAHIAERNSLAMHALMHTSDPALNYDLPETLAAKHKVWQLRTQGLGVYFTQDAGPNIKLLFLKDELDVLLEHFPQMDVLHLPTA